MGSAADLPPMAALDGGANVTVTVCAAAPGLIVKAVGVTVNCAASVPETVIPVTLSAAVPVFDAVRVNVLF